MKDEFGDDGLPPRLLRALFEYVDAEKALARCEPYSEERIPKHKHAEQTFVALKAVLLLGLEGGENALLAEPPPVPIAMPSGLRLYSSYGEEV